MAFAGRWFPNFMKISDGRVSAQSISGGRKPPLKKRIDKLNGVKLLQIIKFFPDADVF
jgi:hypothetical protein